jgi:thiopeptide-type bacteriocin biosynthesis protein
MHDRHGNPVMARQSSEWLQLNVTLARRDGSALPAARALLRDLEGVLSRSRQTKALPFFFQRKPPDLRVRLFGVRAKLMVRLRPVISRAKSEGHVVNSFYSVYEPEQRQFGGRECMQCVHAYWAADSLAWIMLDRLVETDAIGIPRATLIATVMDDLFLRTLSDTAEVWDTWCNLEVLLQSETGTGVPPADAISLDSLIGSASDAEAVILLRYRQANAVLAAGLQRAWRLGRMSCGIRSILPYVALFMLNRHGFDRTAAAPIARAMAAVWNPKQHLRGSQPDRIARASSGRSSDRAGKTADPARNTG